MFGSDILDVAVGLIFLFLLLSLICSSIKEAIETVLKYRARFLHEGIKELLRDGNRSDLVDAFYRHPIINALFRGEFNPRRLGNLPSYIPAKAFSIALLDILNPAATVPEGVALPGAAGDSQPVAQLRATVLKVANPSVRSAILPLIDAAGNDIDRVRRNIEEWYNGVMDRVSGWYKRRTQIIIAAVAFGIAVLMNVDAIGIARYLYTDQLQRSVIVGRAEIAAKGNAGDQKVELADPLGWIKTQGGIPVGWVMTAEPGQSQEEFEHDWRKRPSSLQSWFLKIAGILFTTFAVSLGAPFWFDVLNRVMVIRSTVKPQEKSRDEKSKA
ncbi:MAG: hypothetical protein JWP08_2802 [Bryobacterales bacterium]|nr:hypothetical protein [Bryobacterales bacterium]